MQLRVFLFLAFTCIWSTLQVTDAVNEFSFELEDKSKECFYEVIKKGEKVSMEYQVIKGGNNDVDCYIEDPDGLKLYSDKRKSYDVHEWDAQKEGQYAFCFSNEFSTITHKVVFFQLQVGDEKLLLDSMDKPTALTQMEARTVEIHEKANEVINHQTKFRLREASGRSFAEALNSRVQIWSAIQLVIMFVVMTTQIIIVKGFFAGKNNASRSVT